MPASPPAPLVPHHPSEVLHHPPEKGSFSPASTPHRIECLSIHSSSTSTTRRSALLLCPHAASHTPPTKAPPFLGFSAPPFASPSQTSHPPLPSVCTWFLGLLTRILRLFGLPHLFRFFPSVRIGSILYFPLVSVLSLSGRFNHLK